MLITILAVLAAMAAGIPLSLWATARLRRSNKGLAMASALFFGMGPYNREAQAIAEAREDEDFAARQKSSDPPQPV